MLILCPKCAGRSEIEHVEHGRTVKCFCGAEFLLDSATVLQDYSSIDKPPPGKIGPYKIKRFLGRGGMGSVYKGIHPTLHLPVAVKTLLRKYASDASFKARFIHSAKICARLSHPNVVRVYDFGSEPGGLLYLVLEYIGGGTLFDILRHAGPLPPERVAKVGHAVCSALIEAEKFGIVHRDIKPDNIMIDAEGVYKLSDLGLAKMSLPDTAGNKRTNASADPAATSEFTSLGTPEYMAPEQFLDAKHCDIRADIYSLGVTLYQLSTGRLPFETHDKPELRRRHMEELPKVPSFWNEAIPGTLEYIIMRCLQKESSDRYQTPEEMKQDLEAFLAGSEPPSLFSISSGMEKDQKPISGKRRFIGVFVILVIFVILLQIICFLVWKFLLEPAGSEPPPSVVTRPFYATSCAGNHPVDSIYKPISPADEILPEIQEKSDPPEKIPPVREAPETASSLPQKTKPEDPPGWEETKTATEKCLQENTPPDQALQNLEPFLNSVQVQEAARLKTRLCQAREHAVKKYLNRLSERAGQALADGNSRLAAEIFSAPGSASPWKKETRTEREQLKREFLIRIYRKKVIRRMAQGAFENAQKLFLSPENPEKPRDKLLHSCLNQLIALPAVFATHFREQLRSWPRGQGNAMPLPMRFDLADSDLARKTAGRFVSVQKIEPPVFYLAIRLPSDALLLNERFTLRDLTPESQRFLLQESVIRAGVGKNETAPPELVRDIWLFSAFLRRSVFDTAEEILPRLPEEYRMVFQETLRNFRMEEFRKKLLVLLKKSGYDKTQAPSPEEIPALPFFTRFSEQTLENFRKAVSDLKHDFGNREDFCIYFEKLHEAMQSSARILSNPSHLPSPPPRKGKNSHKTKEIRP